MTKQFHSWVYIWKKNKKTLIQKNTCTPMFIAALFIISKTWKQTKCPSTVPLATTWTDLESIMKCSKSDGERQVLYDNHLHVKSKKFHKLVDTTRKRQTHRYREQRSGYQLGEGRREGQIRG